MEEVDMQYLLDLGNQPLPVRVTDPQQMRMLRRLNRTGHVEVVFDGVGGAEPSASILKFTPLGEKVLKCIRTGRLAPASHNRTST
jgi:hypothetical protein